MHHKPFKVCIATLLALFQSAYFALAKQWPTRGFGASKTSKVHSPTKGFGASKTSKVHSPTKGGPQEASVRTPF